MVFRVTATKPHRPQGPSGYLLVMPKVNTSNYAVNIKQIKLVQSENPAQLFEFRNPDGPGGGTRSAQWLLDTIPDRRTWSYGKGTDDACILIPRDEIYEKV